MPTVLAVSPHLDDAVFSCGGVLAVLAARGWRVIVATVFTRSVHPARGFALECQRDKGLSDDVDYMALRRREDVAATSVLGAEAMWLDFAEAPHRGYDSAAALFACVRPDDTAARDVAPTLARLCEETAPDLVLAPAAIGGHVDHCVVVDALLSLRVDRVTGFWRDVPYISRHPAASPPNQGVASLPVTAIDIGDTMEAKIAAAACYSSQIGFQFGGEAALAQSLRAIAAQEGGGKPAERLHMPQEGFTL